MNKTTSNLSQMIDSCIAHHGHDSETLITSMLTFMSQEVDLSSFAGWILKLLPLPQLPLKKIVCTFLIRYSEVISDLNILATNTLLKDFKDPNPLVRKLVIKTVCSIPCLKELSEELLPKALIDPSAAVRRTAVLNCPSIIEPNHPITETLYKMIRDPDAYVVSNCISALDEILKNEGGIVINNRMISYLLGRMTSFPEWCFTTICNILKKYKPKNEEEVLDFLNSLDEKLDSKNPIIFIAAVQLFQHFIQPQCKHLEQDFIEKISKQLIHLLHDSSGEVLHSVLSILEDLIPKHEIFSKHYKHFFCRFSDPIYVKVKKLSILPLICKESNLAEIMDELFSHCVYNDTVVSQKAIHSYMKILSTHPNDYQKYIDNLIQLTYLKHNNVLEDLIKQLINYEFILSDDLEKQFFTVLSKQCLSVDSDTRESILWLLCGYGQKIDSAPYIVEMFFNDLEENDNEHLQVILITAASKLFFSRPAEMQLLLGQILQKATESPSTIVKDHALFYYSMLKCNPEFTRQLLYSK